VNRTEIIARFGTSNGWLDDHPAITAHGFGRGKVYLVGAWLDESSQRALLDRIAYDAGIEPIMQTPDGVEARMRARGQSKEVLIVINHGRTPQTVTLPWAADEHLTDARGVAEVHLDSYGVGVFTRSQG
jgi:beta-galactosidase